LKGQQWIEFDTCDCKIAYDEDGKLLKDNQHSLLQTAKQKFKNKQCKLHKGVLNEAKWQTILTHNRSFNSSEGESPSQSKRDKIALAKANEKSRIHQL